MKKLLVVLIALFFSLTVFHSCNEPLTEDQSADKSSLKSANSVKSYIVVLNDAELNGELALQSDYEGKQKSAKFAADKILKRAGIADGEIGFVYGSAIKGFSVKIAPGQLKKLQDDPSVKYIEEDQIITLVQPDVRINAKPGGGGTQPAQTTPWGINRVGFASGVGKTAWVIDTGIDLDHPDLTVNTSKSRSFLGGTTTADDQNGHGTHVSGTIAAKNNTIGVIGVAAGATVIAVRVLDRNGSGTTSGVIAGVNYVAANAVSGEVANMSLGGGVSTTLDNAVFAASTLCKFALAAGNESDNANNHSPARVNGPNIYTISAMDNTNKFAYFSNYGNPPIEFCEPGVSIYSCYKGGAYATMSGTSMAAPHAAGLLLLGNINNGGAVIGDPSVPADIIGVR